MERKRGFHGVGPIIAAVSGAYFAAALLASVLRPRLFALDALPAVVRVAVGCVLLAVGVPLFLRAGSAARRAYRNGRLATQGPYAVCRHPVYASALLLIAGFCLLVNSWLVWATPAVAYTAMRILVRREERRLEEEFGRRYAEYRERVNAFFPTIRSRAQRPGGGPAGGSERS
jgi:protein-S-isoprenylcysteine O-methyltransferase Ste14